MRCASCGSRVAETARFCDQCGAALPGDRRRTPTDASRAPDHPTTAAGDRRVVTALFADLVDYVRMLAEHDPEEVRARVTAALATMADAVARFGGTREKFIGDALFAVFGWPRAHDDDAVRAALAALAIRAGLQEIGDGVEPMEVRIGIATGEVVASATGPTRDGDLGLTGEAITTAARIQSLARPGEILLDGTTRVSARERLATADRGSVVLRGRSTAVEIHALLGEAGMGAWTPHRTPAWGPMIGREDEIGRTRALLARLRDEDPRGGIALVVGDAGMGKTRLLAALEDDARALGLAWTWTENVSYGHGDPYRFARLFAQTVADEHGTDSGTFARSLLFTDDLAPEDARRFGGSIAAIARDAAFSGWEAEAPDMPVDPAEVTGTLMEVATRYIERLMVLDGPRVVVIDDVHWLDPSSIGMVELLAAVTTRHPLVLLVGSRPGPLPSWAERDAVVRIDLAGLSEPQTARLATLVARAAVDAEGARRIHERTDGNPLFVGETVRAYLEDGTLALRDGRVAITDPAAATLPVTLRAVLGARIDALDREARDVLDVASVIGIRFDAGGIGGLLGGPPPAPVVLERLADAALIVPGEDDDWRFAHALIRDAAYEGLLASRRRTLHARMADLLERGRSAVTLGAVARHRAAAGDVERALPLLREAAAVASALGATAEASAFERQAAELEARPPEPVSPSRRRSR